MISIDHLKLHWGSNAEIKTKDTMSRVFSPLAKGCGTWTGGLLGEEYDKVRFLKLIFEQKIKFIEIFKKTNLSK